MRRLLFVIGLCLTLVPVAGCSTNPATGARSFMAFMSPEEEKRVGAEEHPKLVQQFGGEYRDAQLDAYVTHVGQSLARTTEMPDLSYSFTVLDDEIVNAFALPGGYVHVSRGLLALATNEAEMAGVIAHELGHINARHSAQRYSKAVATNIGVALLGIAGAAAGLPSGVGDLAGLGAQAYLQSYSREQEMEADTLGVRYMTRAGYDPQAMVTFFEKMQAYSQLQAKIAGDPAAADRFSVMASHPRTTDRIEQAIRLAKATPVANPKTGGDEYLSHIDGLVYGDSPEQGVRRGREFLHPALRIAFRVPPGFEMFNGPNQVAARGPEGAAIVFDRASAQAARSVRSPVDYVERVGGNKLSLQNVERIDVNGMDGATGSTRVNTRGGVVDLRLVVIREQPDHLYRFLFLTPPELTGQLSRELRETTYSFRRLSPEEAAAIKPLRLDVITVRSGDTADSLASRMPVDGHRLELFQVLNGLRPGEGLAPGQKVKVVVE